MSAVDYSLTPAQAEFIREVSEVAQPARARLIRGRMTTHATLALAAAELSEMLAAMVGLAASLSENGREMVELVLVVEGGMHPSTAEKANLPTLEGALAGIALADGIDAARLCAGCAFRMGTPANQSPVTTADAGECAEPGEEAFYCHEEFNADGSPAKACAGFALRRAALRGAEHHQGGAAR